MNAVSLIARKEVRELLRGDRGLAWLLALSTVLSAFGMLLVSERELSLLDNAEVVYDVVGLSIALGAVLAVLAGSDAVAGERERGSLLPLLLLPVTRGALLTGKCGGLLAGWTLVFAFSLPYLWAVAGPDQDLVRAMVAEVLFGTPVILAFGFLSLGLGGCIASQRGTMSVAFLVLVLCASPELPGPSLAHTALGRAFAAVDPLSAALEAADAVIVDAGQITGEAARLAVTVGWLAASALFSLGAFRRLAA